MFPSGANDKGGQTELTPSPPSQARGSIGKALL